MRSATGLVLGYHGCDADIADILVGGTPFKPSRNEWDWLGDGAYFWENDPDRARSWPSRPGRDAAAPTAVVGAVIDPGWCLDLTTQASLDVIRRAFEELDKLTRAVGKSLVENKSDLRRERDRAVLNFLHESMPAPKFQTVRGIFTEGGPLYEGAGIMALTHVQWAVRDISCIKGVFRVR